MSEIITEDDLKREIQGARCKAALREAGIPEKVLAKFNASPMLFQFAHLVVFLEMPWQNALIWINDHKGEIYEHARRGLNEQDAIAPSEADRKPNGGDVGATRKG